MSEPIAPTPACTATALKGDEWKDMTEFCSFIPFSSRHQEPNYSVELLANPKQGQAASVQPALYYVRMGMFLSYHQLLELVNTNTFKGAFQKFCGTLARIVDMPSFLFQPREQHENLHCVFLYYKHQLTVPRFEALHEAWFPISGKECVETGAEQRLALRSEKSVKDGLGEIIHDNASAPTFLAVVQDASGQPESRCTTARAYLGSVAQEIVCAFDELKGFYALPGNTFAPPSALGYAKMRWLCVRLRQFGSEEAQTVSLEKRMNATASKVNKDHFNAAVHECLLFCTRLWTGRVDLQAPDEGNDKIVIVYETFCRRVKEILDVAMLMCGRFPLSEEKLQASALVIALLRRRRFTDLRYFPAGTEKASFEDYASSLLDDRLSAYLSVMSNRVMHACIIEYASPLLTMQLCDAVEMYLASIEGGRDDVVKWLQPLVSAFLKKKALRTPEESEVVAERLPEVSQHFYKYQQM